VGRPQPDMHTSVTLTRSNVKVKVTGLLKFREIALFYVYLLRHFGMELRSDGWSW